MICWNGGAYCLEQSLAPWPRNNEFAENRSAASASEKDMFDSRPRVSSHKLICWVSLLVPLSIALTAGCGNHPQEKPIGSSASLAETERLTFVQWSDPHVFDAGGSRKDQETDKKGIEEEPLDNWSALHWAVLQTNRLVREGKKIDFVAITGDFGLYNVILPIAGKYAVESCRRDAKEGPIPPVSMDEAVQLTARELGALAVDKVYLVPGNNDLCDENPANLYRWAEFVLKLKEALASQQKARQASLDCAHQSIATEKKTDDLPKAPPNPPEIIDLTFTAEKLYQAQPQDVRIAALYNQPSLYDPVPPCELKTRFQPESVASSAPSSKNSSDKNSSTSRTTNIKAGKNITAKKDDTKTVTGGQINSARVPPGAPVIPVERGFNLLGLNSAYFKPGETEPLRMESEKSSPTEMQFVNDNLSTGGPYLLFTHVPDIEDPYLRKKDPAHPEKDADEGSSWKLPRSARANWKNILQNESLLAVFAGHFHDSRREIYPHNFTYATKPLDQVAAQKIWIAPPLAAKVQNSRPAEKTARGMVIVTISRIMNATGPLQSVYRVDDIPIWFTPLDQVPLLPSDDKFAAIKAEEVNGTWDLAASGYKAILDDSKTTDPGTRIAAVDGFNHAQQMMGRWWWKSPLVRWFYLHWKSYGFSLAAIFFLVVIYGMLRSMRVFRGLMLIIKIAVVPRFRGEARVNPCVKLTPDAPGDEFSAQLLAAGEEIRKRLLAEQETWAARHVSLLAPASATFDNLLNSIPKVGTVDVGTWVKFLAALVNTFQWNLQIGIAVLPPDSQPPTPPATTELPINGELSGYAILQWGFFVKNVWRRRILITEERSAVRELARQMAELVLGEAFL